MSRARAAKPAAEISLKFRYPTLPSDGRAINTYCMARTIVVNFDGEVSEFGLTRVSREKLYGRKLRLVVDESGEPTDTAYLTRDGSALLLKGAMASIYVDEDFEVTERGDLQAVDANGEPIEPVDSTLGVEQKLEGPVDPTRVLDHNAKAVYELDPELLGDSLRELLEEGKIFETRFNYRKSFDDAPIFLLQNDEGFFAVVGDEAKFEFLYKNQAQVADDDDDDDPFGDDDLDFSMM